jgi:ribosomal protein L13E
MRGPLRVYDRLTKKIDRYTKRLDRRSPNRNRTQTRLREAEQSRHSWVGFIAMGLGTEKTAATLGLPTDEVAAARQAMNQWALEHNRAEIEEFVSRPETRRRLRSHDTRR